MEPALTAVLGRAAVPGDRQCLKTAPTEINQVLLQRLDTEGIKHLEFGQGAIRPIGGDEITAVALTETRACPGVFERLIGKVTQHRIGPGVGHGMGML